MKVFVIGLLWILTIFSSWADNNEGVAREVPEIFTKELADLLTPVEEVLQWENPFKDGEDSDGTVLLSERVTWVDEEGLCIDVLHSVYQAHTDAGASQLGSDRIRYSALLESPILVLARSYGGDGEWIEVGEKEAFLQRGRGQAGSDIYDDSEELVLIFPEVKPGVVTESVVILKDRSARVEGEYFSIRSWEAGWPYLMRRRVLDLPAAMADRLQEQSLGRGVPERVEIDAPEGRWRAQWENKNRGRTFWEPSRAPSRQVGPSSFLSTWDSWDDLSRWYSKKLNQSAQLSPELLAEAAGWVGEEKGKEEIAAILLERVSLEVRYTGLEFGHSSLEPYDCETVWRRKFGDCKDKANLLVQLLKHYEIEARVVLVNTEHAGLVNRRSPSYREFNHAIAAIRFGEGWQFCDPTIPGAQLGVLAPSSSERDAFLVDAEGGEWARIPKGDPPQLKYHFETEFDAEGRLSGWLEFRASGFYEFSYRDDYRERSRASARRFLTDQLKGFFEGIEVVDIEFPEGEEGFVVKAFFTGQPVEPDSEGRRVISFPTSSSLFLDFGKGDDRETGFFLWRDEIEVSCQISLAEGLALEGLPRPIVLESDGYGIKAGWELTEDGCRARLQVSSRDSLLEPEEVEVVAQANRAFSSWAESPVFVKAGEKVSPNAVKKAGPRMPLLSTGEAQLELADKWFPLGADSTRRRDALRDVIRFFPNNQEVAFDVRSRLAYLDYYEDENAKAAEQYQALTELAHASLENRTFAEYMWAHARLELGEREEALNTMKKLAELEGISEYRRGWSATWAGDWLMPEDPAEAEKFYRMALAYEEEFRERALTGLVSALLNQEAIPRLAVFLENGLLEQEELFREEVSAVMGVADSEKESQTLAAALAMVSEGLPEEDFRKALFESKRGELMKGVEQREVLSQIHRELRELLKTEQLEYFGRAKIAEEDDTREEFEERLKEYYNVKNDLWLAYAAEYIIRFEAGDYFSEHLWNLLGYIKWLENPSDEKENFFPKLVKLTDRIPHGDGNYWECQFVKAFWLEARERFEEAVEVYAAMPDDPDFDPDFNTSAAHRQGLVLEKLGRWDEAVVCYRRVEDQRRTLVSVVHHLVRAGILLVNLEREEEALEVFALFRDVPRSLYEESELRLLVEESLLLADNAEKTRQFWQASRAAWAEGFGKDSGIKLSEPFGALMLTQEELTGFDENFPEALKAGDEALMKEMVARVYTGVAVFPSRVELMTTVVMTYLKPNEAPGETTSYQALLSLAEVVLEAPVKQATREFALRICGGVEIDIGDPDKAFMVLSGCVEEFNAETSREHQERAVYLYLLAAIKAEKKADDIFTRVVEVTSEEISYVGRVPFVRAAARFVSQTESEKAGYEFVIAQSEVRAGDLTPEVKAALLDFAEELKASGFALQEMVTAFDEWSSDLDLPWLAHLEPKVAGLAELDEARFFFKTGETGRHPLEQFKLMSEVLRSPEVDPELASSALSYCLSAQEVWTRSNQVYFEKIVEAIYDERFPVSARSELYYSALFSTSVYGQSGFFEQLKAKPVWAGEVPPGKDRMFRNLNSILEAETEKDYRAILASFGEASEKRELDAADISFLEGIVQSLSLKGELGVMREMLKSSKDWKTERAVEASLQQSRLQWSQSLRQTEPYVELNESLRKVLSGLVADYVGDAPEGWEERADLNSDDDWTFAEKRGVFAARVSDQWWKKSRLDERLWFSNSEIWAEDAAGELREAKVLQVIKIVLEWSQEFDAALALLSLIDFEFSPAGQEKLRVLLKPFDDPRENPDLYAVRTLWEALHRKKPIRHRLSDLETAADESSILQGFIDFTVLLFAIENGSRRESERVLDSMEGERLLRERVLLPAVHLMETLGSRDIELEIASEKGLSQIDKAVLDSWQKFDLSEAKYACELAALIGAGDHLPKAWARSIRKKFASYESRLAFNSLYALAKEDWATLEKEASKLDAAESDFSSKALWGTALFEQGKFEESLAPLRAAADYQFIDRNIFLAVEAFLSEAEEKVASQVPTQ